MTFALQTTCRKQQVATYTWCTRRAHKACVFKHRVWHQATVMQQQPFEPLQFGYSKDRDGQLLPVTTLVLPAPQAIIELVRCQCKTLRFSCRHNNLPCIELCLCDTDGQCTNDEDCNIENENSDNDNDDQEESVHAFE